MTINHGIESPQPKPGLTLDKAIEILTAYQKDFHPNTDFDYVQAVRLGIEALRRVNELRKYSPAATYMPLHGETEEYCKFCGIAHIGIECPDRGREK